MNKLKFHIGIFLIVLTCSCEIDLSGDHPCQGNGEVQFMNRSTTGKTYEVVWDNIRMTTLSPGSESETFTVTAGEHTMRWIVSNSNSNACVQATVSIPECIKETFSCAN